MTREDLEIKMRESLAHFKFAPIVPFISGATALAFLGKIIFSDLPDSKYWIAVVATLIVFGISSLLFYLLKRVEQDKDKYLLGTVGKIVEDVFKHYGVSMASNAAGPTTATQMNPIMKTIVNLVSGLKELMSKTYTKN